MTRRDLAERLLSTRAVLPRALVRRLDRPVRPFAVVMGWIGSTVLFLLVSSGLGGPAEGDSAEVIYGTWAVAHGHLACVYPVVTKNLPLGLADPFALAAPLYSLLSGVVAAALRIGHSVPFPSSRALGPSCRHGFVSIYHWSVSASAALDTVRIGYMAWIALLAGVAYLLRGTDRRHTGWEVVTPFLVAVAPPVAMSLTFYFHPQDLLAMGLVLLATGAFIRQRFVLCGVMLGLALTAQQFAVLAAVVLLALAGRRLIPRMVAAIAGVLVVLDGPFVAVSGLRALKNVALGSSRVGSDIASRGGTVLFSTGIHGIPAFLVARVAPIAAAFLVGLWLRRTRSGEFPSADVVTAAVVVALFLRLVFEVNIFGYYFMATMVGMALIEALRRQIGRDVLAFTGLFLVAFNPEHVGLISNITPYALTVYYDIPIVVLALGVLALLYGLARRRFSPSLIVWIAVVALAGESHLWGRYNAVWSLPNWAWQIVLGGYAGLILARRLRPLTSARLERVARVLEDELHP